MVNYRAPLGRDELLVREIKSADAQKYAFAVACDDAMTIEGAHARVIRYIYDESKGIPWPTWDSAEGAFAGSVDICELAEWLAISTAGIPAGRFYDIQTRKPGYEDWYATRWTIEQLLESGMVSEKWVRERRNQWTEKSPMYINQVLGNFASWDENAMIPLAWIEAANKRWYEWDKQGRKIPDGAVRKIGYDPAGEGSDKNCKVTRYTGLGVTEIKYYNQLTEMESTGMLKNDYEHNGKHPVELYVEVGGGYGGGITSRLKEQGVPYTAVKPGAAATATDISGELQYLNMRAQLTFAVMEWLNPESGYLPILPPDDRLTADLTCLRLIPLTSAGKIKAESKETLGKADRLGRSTDGLDGLKNTFHPKAIKAALTSSEDDQKQSSSALSGRRGAGRIWH